MEFNKLSSPSLKDLFIREIENMILSGKLDTGEKLPSERELADKMGVSRIVVNSGLTELSNVGFVEIIPRKGAYVADYRRKGTIDTLLAILRFQGGELKNNEMKSLLEIRLVIEVLAIELAVEKLTLEDCRELDKKYFEFTESQNPKESAQTIFSFHHELSLLSGNTMLPLIFYSFKELSTMLWCRYFELHGKEALVENTFHLLESLKNRDKDRAIDYFKESLQKTIHGNVSIYFEET